MRRLLIAAAIVMWPVRFLEAQSTSITVTGRITARDDGSPIAAWVETRSRETGAVRRAATDVEGVYRILGLSSGAHDVTVRALGYHAQRRVELQLVVGDRVRADFALEREVVELEPTVIVARPTLEVERLDVSTPVLRREIERLPLNNRNVLGLAALAPGMRSYGTEAGRAIPTAGALSTARFVNFYVDGMEWKGVGTGQLVGQPQTGSLLPQEALREFRVYQNPYDAEFTRGASWVISAVTEQGGNDLHGSLFGFQQGRALVARSAFQQSKPDYARSQVGASLRGPLARDRLFFALSYEGQSTDNYVDVVPGRPNATPGVWDQQAGTFAAPFRNRMGMAHLTALAGPHTLDATWIARSLTNESSFGVQQNNVVLSHDAATTSTYAVTSVQLRDRYVLPSFVNELSIRLLRADSDDEPLRPGPTLRYPGIQFGRTNFPITSIEHHLSIVDKITLITRAFGVEHQLKMGAEVTQFRGNGFQPTSKDGFFNFATDTSTLPMNAQIGIGYLDPSSTDDARNSRNSWTLGAYLQDQWRPVPSLTVAAGLRYDADIHMLNQGERSPWAGDTVLQRVAGDRYLNSDDRVNDLNNVAPRIAMAWDVTGRGTTSLRAGYGVMYDRVPVFGAFSEEIAWRWRIYVIQNPGTIDPDQLRQRVIAAGSTSAPSLVLLPDHLRTPANHQWSLGLGRRLNDRMALNVDYVDQRITHMPVTVRANTVNSATRQRRLTNRYGDIFLWGDFGDARFRGLLSSLTYDRAATRVSVAYTLSSAESEVGAVSTSDFPDSASYAMQQSDGDERHRVVLSGATEMPHGFTFSLLAITASPRPYAVIVGTDVNQDGLLTDDWPGGVRTERRTGLENWYRTIDARFGKAFAVTHGSLIATVEVFNLFNWANHSEYQGTKSLLGYGQPIGDYARRQGQVGLRFEF